MYRNLNKVYDPESRKRWRTDYIGIAMQYAGSYKPKPKREEFDRLRNMTLDQIVDLIYKEDQEQLSKKQ